MLNIVVILCPKLSVWYKVSVNDVFKVIVYRLVMSILFTSTAPPSVHKAYHAKMQC